MIQIWNKITGFCYEKVEKKIDFVIFDPKKSWPRLGLGWISEKRAKIVKKFFDYLVLGMFMDKVKKFCEPSLILWEMAGNLLTIGQNPPPPHLLGLNHLAAILHVYAGGLIFMK